VMMKDSVMEEYKRRFKRVICLFDNDKAGINLSLEFTERYNVPHIYVPGLPGMTDFSDMVKLKGVEKSKRKFKQILDEIRW